MMKKFICCITTLLLTLGVLLNNNAVFASEKVEKLIDSGNLENHITYKLYDTASYDEEWDEWNYDDNYKLVISGTGKLSRCIDIDALNSYEPYYINKIIINEGITQIGELSTDEGDELEGVFENCRNLQSVELPKSLKVIGDATFHWCDSLTSITIPGNVTSIGCYAFGGCSIKSIQLPDSLNYLGASAFYENNIESITIPNQVTKINGGTFSDCKNLKKVVLHDEVTYVGEWAFSDCTSLMDFIIPKGVSYIHPTAFSDCDKINLKVNEDNSVYCNEGNIILTHDKKTLVCAPTLNSMDEIPESVTVLGKYSFIYNDKISNLKIPNHIERIDERAFYGNESIKSIEIPSSVKTIGKEAFACTYVTQYIKLHEGLERIEDRAFEWSGDEYIKNYITIPKSVKYIGEDAFRTEYRGAGFSEIHRRLKVYYGTYAHNFVLKYNKANTYQPEKFRYDVLDVPMNKTLSSMTAYYTAKNVKPTVSIKFEGKTLKNGTDYSYTYTKASKLGSTVKVTIKGKGNYIGAVTKSVKITKKPISKLTIKGVPSTKTYTGKQIKPSIKVYNGSKKLKYKTDYTVSYGKNKSTGKATIKIKANSKSKYYSGSITKTFYIVPKKVTISSAKSTTKAKITVRYKKSTGSSAYQIAYKKKGTSKWYYKYTTKLSYNLTKLSSKKYYYVKVRGYKIVSKKKYYGSYSSLKTVKVK